MKQKNINTLKIIIILVIFVTLIGIIGARDATIQKLEATIDCINSGEGDYAKPDLTNLTTNAPIEWVCLKTE